MDETAVLVLDYGTKGPLVAIRAGSTISGRDASAGRCPGLSIRRRLSVIFWDAGGLTASETPSCRMISRGPTPSSDPMRPNSSPAERDRGRPARAGGHGTLEPSAGTEDDPGTATDLGWVIETVVSPFHCLYQDALHFHTQSRLAQSEGEATRLARAALLLYISSAEALVRQAAVELGRPELRGLLADPSRPLPLAEAWRLLPAIVAEPGVPTRSFDPESPPWPQFAELLMLETSWVYPGPRPAAGPTIARPAATATTSRSSRTTSPPRSARMLRTETLTFPRTGLPRDPYCPAAAPPRHRPGHPRRRHRGPRPPHGRRPLPRPAPSPRAGPRGLSDAERERDLTAGSCRTGVREAGIEPLSWACATTP